jgi:hypothetical protein
MKTRLFAIIASLCIPALSGAATLAFDYSNLADSSGTLLTSGVIRFGVFQTGTNFNQSIGDLADEFIQIGSYTITGNNAFTGLTYNEAASFSSGDSSTTIAYDLTPGSNAASLLDIAGTTIYAWVLNSNVNASVTEHGIFSSFYLWTDADQLLPDNNSTFSFDVSSGDGMTAHIGTASDDIFNPASPHRLAAIPEPSRALLGLIGLTGVMFRRRRAAKA